MSRVQPCGATLTLSLSRSAGEGTDDGWCRTVPSPALRERDRVRVAPHTTFLRKHP
jgi:hypothetical protein